MVSPVSSLRKMIMIALGTKHLFPFWAEGPCDFLILDKPPMIFALLFLSLARACLPLWHPEMMLYIIFMSNSSLVLALNLKTLFRDMVCGIAAPFPNSQTRMKSPCTYRFPQLLFRIDSSATRDRISFVRARIISLLFIGSHFYSQYNKLYNKLSRPKGYAQQAFVNERIKD